MDLFSTSPSRQRSSFTQNSLTNNVLSKIINKPRMTSRQQLEEVIDVDKEIQLFQQNKLKLLNARTLYNEEMFSRAQLYRHYREEQMCVIRENSCSINLISSDSLKEIIKLKKKNNKIKWWE